MDWSARKVYVEVVPLAFKFLPDWRSLPISLKRNQQPVLGDYFGLLTVFHNVSASILTYHVFFHEQTLEVAVIAGRSAGPMLDSTHESQGLPVAPGQHACHGFCSAVISASEKAW